MTPAKPEVMPEWLADIAQSLPPLLTIKECSKVLHIHERTVRMHVETGTLLAVRNVPGGSSRFLIPRASVLRWLSERATQK